jgi:hypothetical protein
MTSFIVAVPAYGRDYTTKEEVLADWADDKDFKIIFKSEDGGGRYFNRQDMQNLKDTVVEVWYRARTLSVFIEPEAS